MVSEGELLVQHLDSAIRKLADERVVLRGALRKIERLLTKNPPCVECALSVARDHLGGNSFYGEK